LITLIAAFLFFVSGKLFAVFIVEKSSECTSKWCWNKFSTRFPNDAACTNKK